MGGTVTDSIGIVSSYFDYAGWIIKGAIIDGKQYGTVLNVEDKYSVIPKNFQLYQNYPNPFNPTTTISYSLPEQSFVTVKVMNVLGQEVATLANEMQDVGVKAIQFGVGATHVSPLPSGVYFYRISAVSKSQTFIQTQKMVLLK